MSETHINVFIREVEDAFKAAVAAIGELETKVGVLRSKYESKIKELDPQAEKFIAEVEDEVKKVTGKKPKS